MTRQFLQSRVGKAAVLVVAAGCAYTTFAYGVANVTRASNPSLALRLIPGDARAQVARAEQLIGGRVDISNVRAAGDLGRKAMQRDATIATAARLLAMREDAHGNKLGADRLMGYSAQLSRRDLPTRLYLIETAVARDDVQGALGHFDIALRTSEAAYDILFPVLSSAIEDDRLIVPVARVLAQDPPWLSAFLLYATRESPSPANLARILSKIPKSTQSQDKLVRQRLLDRLVADARYDEAHSYFASLPNVQASDRRGDLRDPDFARPQLPAPFGWRYYADAELGANTSVSNQGDSALQYYAVTGRGGLVASQLLVLRPGTYELFSSGTNSSSDSYAKPIWEIICAGREDTRLAAIEFPITDNTPKAFKSRFNVPQFNCEAQWLRLVLRASQDPNGLEGIVTNVTIRPASGTS